MLKNRTLVLLLAAALAGCGGSSSSHRATSRKGSFQVTLNWPPVNRLVPAATNTVKVSIYPEGSTTAVDSITFLRSETGSGGGAVRKTNSLTLNEGLYRLEAKAYHTADLSDNPIAAGSTGNIEVKGGQTVPANITMASKLAQFRVTVRDLTTGAVLSPAGGYVVTTSGIVGGTPAPVLPAGDQIGFEAVPEANDPSNPADNGALVLLPTNLSINSVLAVDGAVSLIKPANTGGEGTTLLQGTLVSTSVTSSGGGNLRINYTEGSRQFTLPVTVAPFAASSPSVITTVPGVAGGTFKTVDSVAVVTTATTPQVFALATQALLPSPLLTRVVGPQLNVPTTATDRATLAAAGNVLAYQVGESEVARIDTTTGLPLAGNVNTPLPVDLLSSSDYDEDLASDAVGRRLYAANVNNRFISISALSFVDSSATPIASFQAQGKVLDFAVGRDPLTGGRIIFTLETDNNTNRELHKYADSGSGFTRVTGYTDTVNGAVGTPQSVAVTGNVVWCTDTNDNAVKVIDSNGNVIATYPVTLPGGANTKLAGLSVAGRQVAASYTNPNGGNPFAGIATFTY